jgi:hypothetical protein
MSQTDIKTAKKFDISKTRLVWILLTSNHYNNTKYYKLGLKLFYFTSSSGLLLAFTI